MRRIFDILDDIAIVDDFTNSFKNGGHYKFYDPSKYDLVPKESYKKELAEAKKKEIESLEKEKETLDKRIKELKSS